MVAPLSPGSPRTPCGPRSPLQPGNAALAGRGNKLPSRTGAGPRRIPKCDPGATIAGYEVVLMILAGLIPRAAHSDVSTVTARSGEARPVRGMAAAQCRAGLETCRRQ